MKLGLIIGKIWSAKKDKQLDALKMYLLQPVDENKKSCGQALVAIDSIGSGAGDLVYWVSGAEAMFPFKNRIIPSDATIVGIVDRVNL
ncbi:MAG: ethanolamine utilization protein EutN [Calditrichaeota bacterium]|nr:MAG: ethanolamine utilization protein EutN [Calditrichota bacterium]